MTVVDNSSILIKFSLFLSLGLTHTDLIQSELTNTIAVVM